MNDYDDPHTRPARSKPVKVTADPVQVKALEDHLAHLARLEDHDPTYAEMCRAATAKKMGAAPTLT